jgi:GH18 family chitinase
MWVGTILLCFHAHNVSVFLQGVKASLSIGGSSGSIYFSSNVASAQNRTAFVKAVTGLVTKYNLDAIDLEYVSIRFSP